MSASSLLYSVNCKGIKEAASDLINNTAESLIRYIYAPVLHPGIKTQASAYTVEKGKGGQEQGGQEQGGQEQGEQEQGEREQGEREQGGQEPKELKEGEQGEREERDPDSGRLQGYTSREIRIGLSIRILVKSNCGFDEELIELILKDIESLRHDTDYLLSFPDPRARREALGEEYSLVQGFIDLDDTISLNQELGEGTTVPSRNMYKMADSSGCAIQ